MVNFTILAGGYATFVASYLFNTDTSTLTLLNQSPTGANPSWISPDSVNSSILYAVNENSPGALQSFTIGKQGLLSDPQGQVSSQGNTPAFTTRLSTGQVAIMNYGSGSGLIVPTANNALSFESAPLISFPAPVSHPHMAVEHGSEVLVPDLGADRIWRLVENGDAGSWRIQGQITQPTGSGPRHIAIFDGTLYTVHELASTLTAQTFPAAPNGTSTITTQLSTVPPNNLTSPMWAAAEILIPTPNVQFETPYIYVSNRNTGSTVDPRGDTIAVFETQTGPNPTVKLVAQVYTGLQQVRGMMIGGPNDEFIVAGGVVGTGGVVVFKRTNGGASLQEVARNTVVPTRTSFIWGNW
ncbi:Lactonase, 7-bladed beta-propeller-domain-containing protein [Gloeopeniophorella convolvens]|nr:Lactonase, 7-bladed beta-propeller-domain-containing protein [Gloeopeniophorella convolvens]